LAADRPAPLYEAPTRRIRYTACGDRRLQVEEDGFSVQAHAYYRAAVEELGLTMRACWYELDLRATEDDLRYLRAYLKEHFTSGEEVELWGLWVGGEERPLARYRGRLDELDLETLELLEECRQVCLTITI